MTPLAILLALAVAPATEWTWSVEAQLAVGVGHSIDGDTLVVGWPGSGPTSGRYGAAEIFVRSGTAWASEQVIPSNGSTGMGHSTDVNADTIVLGAPYDNHAGFESGSASVFARNGTTWVQQAVLVSADANQKERFGWAVAVHGDTVLVGAPFDSGPGTNVGAVYVFRRTGSTWAQTAKLEASDESGGANFGWALDMDADRALIGAESDDSVMLNAGSAYVFRRVGATFIEEAKLEIAAPAVQDELGYDVSLDGTTALLGAPNRNASQGAAFVFERGPGGWTEQAELTASDGVPPDSFGLSVAVSGGTALVGSPLHNAPSNNTGAVYAYRRDGAAWREETKIVASPTQPQAQVGRHVALDSGTALFAHPALYFESTYVLTGLPGPAQSYCTAGTSSAGCRATLAATGTASATAPTGFLLTATGTDGARSGFFYFGTNGRQAIPWSPGSGYQCVVPPVQRGSRLAPSGTPGACDGALQEDLNTLWSAKPFKNPGVGAVVRAQLWRRDPASASTHLSDALEFTVGP